MVIFHKKWKKYAEIQLTKNKMDLNNRKMTNHPPSPAQTNEIKWLDRRKFKLVITKIFQSPHIMDTVYTDVILDINVHSDGH